MNSLRSKVGLADLLFLSELRGEGAADRYAQRLGYEVSTVVEPLAPSAQRALDKPRDDTSKRPPLPLPPPPRPKRAGPNTRVFDVYYRCEAVKYLASDEQPEPSTPEPLPRRPPREPSSPPPVRSWPDLWRTLRPSLCRLSPARGVDDRGLIAQLSTGRVVRRLPRKQRRTMPRRLLITQLLHWELAPIWEDQAAVVSALERKLGSGAIAVDHVLPMSAGGLEGARWSPRSQSQGAAWQLRNGDGLLWLGGGAWDRISERPRGSAEYLRRLGVIGVHLSSTCGPKGDAEGLTSSPTRSASRGGLSAVPWDNHGRPSAAELEHLLELLSPALFFEVGLVRDVRRLLGLGVEAELALLEHPDIIEGASVGASLRPEARQRYRDRFLAAWDEDGAPPAKRDLQFRAVDLIRHWHSAQTAEFWYEEALELASARPTHVEPEDWFVSQAEVEEAVAFFRAAAEHLQRWQEAGSPVHGRLSHWFRDCLERLRSTTTTREDLNEPLSVAWHVVTPGGVAPPRWVKRGVSSRRGLAERPRSEWTLVQAGGTIAALLTPANHGSDAPRQTSPLCRLATASRELYVDDNGPECRILPLDVNEPRAVDMTVPSRNIVLESPNEAVLTLCPIPKPPWADTIGRDRYGLYADFSIENEATQELITQRMRWINPGRFLMGSPEGEGYDREHPQHQVTLTKGFWLADTAVTQALWLAVMGRTWRDDRGRPNPSRCQGDEYPDWRERPVENVSWHDAQRFITDLERELRWKDTRDRFVARTGEPSTQLPADPDPTYQWRLPTEAEWEYACRAGTQSPFYFGDNITADQVNYDGNYPYGDGAKGEHRQQTVPGKASPFEPSPWGLYHMHGNVWEWCADARRDYNRAMPEDPHGSLESGGDRVLRGGSWYDDAADARSAYRFQSPPDFRDVALGFRLARGHELPEAGSETPERGAGDE